MLRIKEICKEKSMTLKELAKRMGITYQTLFDIMNGNPTLDTLNKIAFALRVNITELFDTPNNTIRCPRCGTVIEFREK